MLERLACVVNLTTDVTDRPQSGDILCTTDWVALPDNDGRYCGFAWPPAGTLTSTALPFQLAVHTDGNEETGESGYNGFALAFAQQTC